MDVDWRNIGNDRLMLWVMHEFAAHFGHHAILKGGMQLMLMSSGRATNDLDYVFVPYESKKDIAPRIEAVLETIPQAVIEKTLHSNSGRYRIKVGRADVQIEFNVSTRMPSMELTTELLARKLNVLPKIIRVMSADVALAHKLAAWNERRLLRDLYDAYYIYTHLGVTPDRQTLARRLSEVKSRLPALSKVRKMTVVDLAAQLRAALEKVGEQNLQAELGPLFGGQRLVGLLPVLRTRLSELALLLERES